MSLIASNKSAGVGSAHSLNKVPLGMRIRGVVDQLQRDPHVLGIDNAVASIQEALAEEFPPEKFHSNVSRSSLRGQLLAGIRDGSPVVLAFARTETVPEGVWSWQVHLVEIGGVAARIEDMVVTIKMPDSSVWRAQTGLRQQVLLIPPFGRVEHRWSCPIQLWRGGTVRLAYFGYYGPHDRLITVHCSALCPWA